MVRLLVVFVLLGVAIYLLVAAAQRRGSGRAWRRRPVAPDDDPTFLRDLDERLWRDRRRDRPDDPPGDQDQSGAA